MPVGSNYSVTDAVMDEQEAIRAVTSAINHLNRQKNGRNKAISSWRARYRYWRGQIDTQVMHQPTEDEAAAITMGVNHLNRAVSSLQNQSMVVSKSMAQRLQEPLQNVQEGARELLRQSVPDSTQVELDTLNRQAEQAESQLTDYLQEQRRYEEQNAKYQDYLAQKQRHDRQAELYEDYQVALKEWETAHAQWETDEAKLDKAEDLLSDRSALAEQINQNEFGAQLIKIAPETFNFTVDQDGVVEVAQLLREQLDEAYREDAESALDSSLWSQVGKPNWSTVLNRIDGGDTANLVLALQGAIYSQLASYVDQQNQQAGLKEAAEIEQKDLREPEKPEEVKPPVPLEPMKQPQTVEPCRLPKMDLVEYHPLTRKREGVDPKLVDQLDEYSKGSYRNTFEHQDEINALQQQIKHDCPVLDIPSQEFKNDELLGAISEIQGTWSRFGGQRNSSAGAGYISTLKEATNALAQVSSYEELKEASKQFDRASTMILMWLASNWWQLGGTPSGNAHAWHGGNARKLVKPRK